MDTYEKTVFLSTKFQEKHGEPVGESPFVQGNPSIRQVTAGSQEGFLVRNAISFFFFAPTPQGGQDGMVRSHSAGSTKETRLIFL